MDEQKNKIILSDAEERVKTADGDIREFSPVTKSTDGVITVDDERKLGSLHVDGMTFDTRGKSSAEQKMPSTDGKSCDNVKPFSISDEPVYDTDVSLGESVRLTNGEQRFLEGEDIERFSSMPEYGRLSAEEDIFDPIIRTLHKGGAITSLDGDEKIATERFKREYGRMAKADTPDVSSYTKGELKKLLREVFATDIAFLCESYEYTLSSLRLEYTGARLRFNKATRKNSTVRSEEELESELRSLEREMKREIAAEKRRNRRLYSLILTDYTTVELFGRRDRELMMRLRSDLFRKVMERHALNVELIELYEGRDERGLEHASHRFTAEIKGKRRAYRRLKRIDALVYKYHFSMSESKRLYALMDEYVDVSGRLSRIAYSLKSEKPARHVKRGLVKEKRKLSGMLRRLDRKIKRNKMRAVSRAKGKKRSRREMFIGWISFFVVVLIVLAVVNWWDPIVRLFLGIFGI